VAYQRDIPGGSSIRAIVYDQNGNVVVPDFLVDGAGGQNLTPQVVATRAGFAVFYSETLGTGGLDVTMSRFTSTGIYLGYSNVSNPNFVTSTRKERDVQVTRLADGNLAVTYWHDQFDDTQVAMRVIRDDGSAVSSEETIFSTAADQSLPDLAPLGRSFVATVVQDSSSGIEMQVHRVRVNHTSDAGADTMVGGQMFDHFIGGAEDMVSYQFSDIAVGVDLSNGNANGGHATGDTFSGIRNLTGSQFNDALGGNDNANHLRGGAGSDMLKGYGGADRLDGGAGADTMEGGLGNDIYFVDNIGDLVQGEVGFAQGGGIDTFFTAVSYTLPANVERLNALAGAGNIGLTGNDGPNGLRGNEGNNRLEGRGGNDRLTGREGSDTLIGGEGSDTLVGGAGADTFVYTAVSNSTAGVATRDTINGFTRGAVQDLIDFSAIDANRLTAGVNDAFSFIGTAAFSGGGAAGAGQLRYQSLAAQNSALLLADVNGDGLAEFQILVRQTTVMVAGDFIL